MTEQTALAECSGDPQVIYLLFPYYLLKGLFLVLWSLFCACFAALYILALDLYDLGKGQNHNFP